MKREGRVIHSLLEYRRPKMGEDAARSNDAAGSPRGENASLFLWNFAGHSFHSFINPLTGQRCAFVAPWGMMLCDLTMPWFSQSVFDPEM